MGIVTGLGALKTAVELTRSLRDAAKRGEVKPEEFAGRVGEIYDYIADSKDALSDAKDEIAELKEQLAALDEQKEIESQLKHVVSVYFREHPDGSESGPYCVHCWKDGHLVPLAHISGTFNTTSPSRRFDCVAHGMFLVPLRHLPREF